MDQLVSLRFELYGDSGVYGQIRSKVKKRVRHEAWIFLKENTAFKQDVVQNIYDHLREVCKQK